MSAHDQLCVTVEDAVEKLSALIRNGAHRMNVTQRELDSRLRVSEVKSAILNAVVFDS